MSSAELGWTKRGERLAGAGAWARFPLRPAPRAAVREPGRQNLRPGDGHRGHQCGAAVQRRRKAIPAPVALNAPFCRVQGSIKPSPTRTSLSRCGCPLQSSWNGKYEGVGNGGFAGSFIYGADGLGAGTGLRRVGDRHRPCRRRLDAAWALRHPEKITDFGWRGIHVTASASKAIIEAYYGKAPAHAYFSGCWTAVGKRYGSPAFPERL